MNRNLNEAIFDIAKVEAIMFAFENTYLELAGDCRVVDAIYAVNDVRRRVGTLKTED